MNLTAKNSVNDLAIDTEDYSLGYVAAWSDMDSKAVLKQLEVIRKTANAILDKVA